MIGGTALGAGGRFSLFASIIGALVIQAITTSMYAVGVPASGLLAIKGFVVILVILLFSVQVRGLGSWTSPSDGAPRRDGARPRPLLGRNRRFAPVAVTMTLFFVAYLSGRSPTTRCATRRSS